MTENKARDLDGSCLANALRAGIRRVFAQTDHLNKINVFPVPDGDTGTNLSMTLSAVLAAIDREPPTHAGKLLERIADAALDGARGNSGAILAQFLLGLADHASHEPKLSALAFADAATAGARYANEAMSQPKEGTLLSVLREFAAALQDSQRADPTHTVHDLLRATQPTLQQALAATSNQLEALRAAHVVDAGAQGFVHLVDGMLHYLDTGEVGDGLFRPMHEASAETMADEPLISTQPQLLEQQPRWCTECLVATPNDAARLDLRHLRESLAPLGSSLVVGGTPHKARIHLHTDDPEQVFSLASRFGTVTGQKADDMRHQTRAAHHNRTQRVAIVTDSAADIPEELIEELGIHVVPLRIHFGNRSYLDKVTMSPAEFYAELARNPEHPKTSQPPPGDFRRMYEFLTSHYEAVVSVELTSKASGTYNAATAAAARVSKEGRSVLVVDSLNASLGLGLIVVAAAERAREGARPGQVVTAARDAIATTSTFALLATVDWAVKGGRVPKLVKAIAELLNLSVILATHPNGKVGLGGVLWGRRRLPERFAHWVCRHRPNATDRTHWRLLVGHANAPAEAIALSATIEAGLPAGTLEFNRLTEIGPAVGAHSGPGTLIASLQQTRPPIDLTG